MRGRKELRMISGISSSKHTPCVRTSREECEGAWEQKCWDLLFDPLHTASTKIILINANGNESYCQKAQWVEQVPITFEEADKER